MLRPTHVVLTAICLVNLPIVARGQAATTRSIVVSGVGEIIAASESGKTLYGYSVHVGTWEGLAVANPDSIPLIPVVGSGVGYVAIGKRIHAFSPATGHWATLELPEVAQPEIYPGSIRVPIGTKIHVFSGVTGKWATVDLAVDMK
jgi:hypothetical protein